MALPPGVEINAPLLPGFDAVLTEPALQFFADLQRRFGARRLELLAARRARAERMDARRDLRG